MEIGYSDIAMEHLLFWKQSGNVKVMKKISQLITAIEQTPFEGIGKPEALKYDLSGFWSRRINQEHRLVYRFINDNEVEIVSLRFHY
jgi:toxin YoeB